MNQPVNRRKLLKIAGASLGFGAIYRVAPLLAAGSGAEGAARYLKDANGEAPSPFSIVQLSDTHVGFNGPPNPLGTKAFEKAVESINALETPPDLVLFTGDLTQDSEDPAEHAGRMKLFQQISSRLSASKVFHVPGEHDAGLDGGALFREHFGETHYSFDHRGVHFVALDNVSLGKPAVGKEQLAWLKKDLARFPATAPIVVFTHRPLFDLKPEWEWFTSDGDDVLNVLAPYENVTVLYGHIHRRDVHTEKGATHYGARSLIFAFPDPASGQPKKPQAFDPKRPFDGLGIRQIRRRENRALEVDDVVLTLNEFSGTVGAQQISKEGAYL